MLAFNEDESTALHHQTQLRDVGANVATWNWSLQADELTWSGVLFELFGFEADQAAISIDDFWQIVFTEDRERLQEAVIETLLTKTSHTIEYRVVGHYGKIRYVRSICHAVIDSSGAVSRLFGTLQDISDSTQPSRNSASNRPTQPLSPKLVAVSLRDLMRLLHQMMIGAARRKGLRFGVSIDPNLPDTVIIDPMAVLKIAANLLSNAIQNTDEGEVMMMLARRGTALSLEVRDTGIGIPPHATVQVLDGYQYNQKPLGRPTGRGIGLSIVRRMTQGLGGSLMVHSQVGQGSTFTVVMPLKAAEDSTE